ncbi:MAG: 4Fe-4S binding protein, partial [bacterium]
YCRKTLIGKISFRQLAVLAGLGSIGKSQMLIHKTLGPRCVIGVVLTNAEIKLDTPQKTDLCIDCGVCEKMCPTKALDKNYDRWECKNRRKILKRGCGIPCVELCPIGRK